MAWSAANSARARGVGGPASSPAPETAQPSLPASLRLAVNPLRVCHVATADLWAGAEVQLATTAAYLAAQTDVRLAMVLFNEGRLADELRALGLEVTIIPESEVNALHIVSRLTTLLKDGLFDVVHTHKYKDTILGAIAARRAGVPHLVRTIHGLHEPATGWASLKLHAYEALDRFTLRRSANVVVAVSKHAAETLRGAGFWPGMVTTIHNGTAPPAPAAPGAAAAIRRELGISDSAMVFGTVGRLVPVKGQADLIRAIGVALPRLPETKLLIVGDGPLHGDLLYTSARMGMSGACVFTGHRSDVPALLAAMDVFVLPSLSEGVPMALLEAMALGKPVVATRVGGIPEIVQDRVTGLLVPASDPRALAEACLEIARYPDWARELGDAGRRVVTEEYTRERAGRALVDTYRSLCRGSRARRRPPSFMARVAGYPRRFLLRVAERERMRQIRRDPGELTRVLRTASNVLVVCLGNINRSAFAAELLRGSLGSTAHVTVTSAGLAATPGRPSPANAIATAGDRRIDLTRHSARPLTAADVRASDVIFVMDVGQLCETTARFPDARPKTFLLTCLSPGTPLEVRDPVDGDSTVFNSCFSHISDAVAPIARVLSDSSVCR